MRRTGAAFVALACAGFVPPKLAREIAVEGVYDVAGTHPDGSEFVGTGTIVRLGGERYRITFDVPGGSVRAICVRSRDVLGCGWGTGELGAALYVKTGGRVEGRWFRDGDEDVGVEIAPDGDLAVPGAYAASGTSPDGTPYQGDFTLDAVASGGADPPSLRRVRGTRAGVAWSGWGVTDGAALAVGFPHERCGAALYRIDGRGVLTAVWMDASAAGYGLGAETMVRRNP